MKRSVFLTWSSVVAVFLLVCSSLAAFASPIRVGLAVRQSQAVVGGSSLTASDAKGHTVSLGSSATAVFRSGKLTVNGKKMMPPVTVKSASPLSYKGRRYLGTMQFVAAGGGLSVVNVLDVEQYLRGVLKMEVNPDWSKEALRAQAIISRTFALRSQGRFASLGFDLCDTPTSQVYGGLSAADPRVNQVVASTKGEVLTYGGELAQTYFHSDSGGATASSQDVWGGYVPYLQTVVDPFPTESRHASWTVRLTSAQIAAACAQLGMKIGPVKRLSIIARDKAGRPTLLRLDGTLGSVTISSNKFRNIIGPTVLRSTFFSPDGNLPKVLASGSAAKPQTETALSRPSSGEEDVDQQIQNIIRQKLPDQGASSSESSENRPLTGDERSQWKTLLDQGAFTTDELIDVLLHPERKSFYLKKALGQTPVTPADQPLPTAAETFTAHDGGFVFAGRGNGHGVGLSQWEAKAMADRGWNAERILAFFFPGTKVERR